MKNIHVLPTDKPSRLHNKNGELGNYPSTKLYIEDFKGNQHNSFHIYITNDEEIKEGDWFYDLGTKYIYIKQSWENSHLDFNGKKIILTTDPDLIKDGVQAIDDEFLEWFVKNPSCKKVEVYREGYKKNGMIDEATSYQYKIIIPKEEPKQETLKEAAEKYANMHQDVSEELKNYLVKAVFQDGANWQSERMYSEEEVIEFGEMIAWNMVGKTITESFIRTVSKELFQQFKKK